MDEKVQMIKLIKDFLIFAEELLRQNKIDYDTYVKITQNKIEFLKSLDCNSSLGMLN